jgi:hypothetical protein
MMESFKVPHDIEEEKRDVCENQHEEAAEGFFELLATDPSVEEVARSFNQYFNTLKLSQEEIYHEQFKKFWEGRTEAVELFVEQTMVNFAMLHDELIDLIGVGNFSEEERAYLEHEAQKVLTLYSGRTLLSLHATQDKMPTLKKGDSLIKRKENAVMLRTLAELVLDDPDTFNEVEEGFDKTGKKVFGKEYENIKTGLVSLVNSCYHLRSLGYEVHFASPLLDAEQAIDLLCHVPQESGGDTQDDHGAFLQDIVSLEELQDLSDELKRSILAVQVKSVRDLTYLYGDTYEKYQDSEASLSTVFKDLDMDSFTIDGVSESTVQSTGFITHCTTGFSNEKTEALFITQPREFQHQGQTVIFTGEQQKYRDPKRAKIAELTQDALMTFAWNKGIRMGYIAVNYKRDTSESKDVRKGFYTSWH